jgi:hypothetical protein
MKKYIIILLVPFLFACGREAKERAQVLQVRTDSLLNQASQKDIAINDFVKSVNDIEGLMDSIKMKENIVSQSAQRVGELKTSSKQQIRNDILSIYQLMVKEKNELAVLSGKLKNSSFKTEGLQKLVAHLQQDLANKAGELDSLHRKLISMDYAMNRANQRIDSLSTTVQTQGQEITEQTQTINEQTTALNTAYYIVGTSKELKDEGILKGGKVVPNFDKSKFTRVDIRNTKEIPLDMKKVKLLSNHPTTAYKLNSDGKMIKSLQVTDNQAFWSNSKYLILETNKPLAQR